VLDLLFVEKNPDGSIEGFESHDFGDAELGELRALETEFAMLLAEEDIETRGWGRRTRAMTSAGPGATSPSG
jgi:hypothetical protein